MNRKAAVAKTLVIPEDFTLHTPAEIASFWNPLRILTYDKPQGEGNESSALTIEEMFLELLSDLRLHDGRNLDGGGMSYTFKR